MGVTSGLCGVDEFHDAVSGLCGHCSDICRDITKPDSCLYHCADYYNRHLSTTVISTQIDQPVTLVVLIPVLVSFIICLIVIIIVITYRFWYLPTHIRNRFKIPGSQNSEREFTVGRFRHRRRVNRHHSVQETRDPNKQEDMQLSVLCISQCSSLILGAESTTEGARFQSLPHDLSSIYLNQGWTKHHIETNAIVSAEDVPLSSEFEETQLKIAGDTESRSSVLNNKGGGEQVKQLSNCEETRTFDTNKAPPMLEGEDVTKHFNVVHNSRLYSERREFESSEASSVAVQESYKLVSTRDVQNERDDTLLHAPLQETYSAISKGNPS